MFMIWFKLHCLVNPFLRSKELCMSINNLQSSKLYHFVATTIEITTTIEIIISIVVENKFQT